MNQMQLPRIEKLTLNIGAGTDQALVDKAVTVLKTVTGIEPIKTITDKRVPAWGLRPGLPIGCKLTLRKKKAEEMLDRLLEAKDHTLKESNFDDYGNVSFGIREHTDIEGVKYDPKIGVMGLQACITLEKPGYRVKRRREKSAKIGKKHRVKKDEAIGFMKEKFKIQLASEVEEEE